MKNLLLLGLTFALFFVLATANANAQWADDGFDGNYTLRQNITVANSDATKNLSTGYTVESDFNLSDLFNAGHTLGSLDDVVISFQGSEINSFLQPTLGLKSDNESLGELNYGDVALDNLTSGTVDVWSLFPTSQGVTYIVFTKNGTSVDGNIFLTFDSAAGRYDGFIGNSANQCLVSSNSGLDNLTWNHLALQWNSSGVFFYQDGVQTDSCANVTGGVLNGTEDLELFPARETDSNLILDEFRISNTDRFTTGFEPRQVPYEVDVNTVMLLHLDGSLDDATGSFSSPTVTGEPKYVEGNILAQGDGTATIKFPLQAQIDSSTSNAVDYKLYYNNSAATSPLRDRSIVYSYFQNFDSLAPGTLDGQDLWSGSGNGLVASDLGSISGQHVFTFVEGGDWTVTRTVDTLSNVKITVDLIKDSTPGQGLAPFFDVIQGGSIITRFGLDVSASAFILTSTGNQIIAPMIESHWYRFELVISGDRMNVSVFNRTAGLGQPFLQGSLTDIMPSVNVTTGITNITLRANDQASANNDQKADNIIYQEFILDQSESFAAEENVAGVPDEPPTFSDNQTNGTQAGTTILHSLLWADDIGLDSFVFSFDNGSGSFVNDSAVSFGAAPTAEWSNVSKSIDSIIGLSIRWMVFANDTAGNESVSDIYSYTSTGAGNPTVTIDSPTNTTFTSIPVNLDVSADQTSSAWWYSLDFGPNITFTPNTTISPANGFHQITVFTNNTLGEEGQATVFFTVNVPPAPAAITGSAAVIVSVVALMLGLFLLVAISRADMTNMDSIIRIVIMVFLVVAFAGVIISFTV